MTPRNIPRIIECPHCSEQVAIEREIGPAGVPVWIRKTTRRFFEDDRAVRKAIWRAQVKIGTQPGDIGLFLSEPEVGSPCELVTDGPDYAVRKLIRVTVDRFDDVSQRVFCSLR